MGTARSQLRRPLLLLAAFVVAAALAATLLGAVGRGAMAGPSITVRLGDYALVARTTEHPDCLPLPQQCFIPRPTFKVPQPRYYAVWVGRISYPVRQGRPSTAATVRGRHILRLSLAPSG